MLFHDYLELWGKVKKLASQKCTISQISAVVGVCRRSVSKLLKFETEADLEAHYRKSLSRPSPKRDSLVINEEFFIRELQNPARFSNSQIMDHYQEHFPFAMEVSASTLSRYLNDLRKRANIPKKKRHARVFRRRDPEGPGLEAQVDFGECNIYDNLGERHSCHIFGFVLCFSKIKFYYVIKKKFDAEHAIYALHKALEYIGGVPKRIIFDRDSVFFNKQDKTGKIEMTKTLDEFAKNVGFTPDFCHARDPQSKGRIEKYIHYVKDNFLKGREFKDYNQLNRQCLEWLSRTANARKHDLDNYSPLYMFHHWEKKKLDPYLYYVDDPDWKPSEYKVRKDNTLMYKRRMLLDVPVGTYKGEGTSVLVDDKTNAEKLIILDINRNILVEYTKKELIENAHNPLPAGMAKEEGMDKYERMLRALTESWLPDGPLSLILKAIRKELGERYYRKGYQYLYDLIKDVDTYSAYRLICYCAEHGKTTLQEIEAAIDTLNIKPWKPSPSQGDGVVLGNYDFSDHDKDNPIGCNHNFSDYDLDNNESDDNDLDNNDLDN